MTINQALFTVVEIIYLTTVYLVILALLGRNGGKEIMAHINFGSPRV